MTGKQLRVADWRHDLAAAMALAAIAIPEQMATARLAGAPAATGLLVFVAASFGFFLAGRNRFLSVGADSTITPIFAGALVAFAPLGSAHYLSLAGLLALLVGLLVAAGGALRLGWIARLLSVPVITGFLAGIAIHIAVSQMPALLGVAMPGGNFVQILAALVRASPSANPWTLGLGVMVFALTLLCERLDIRLPGALIAMALAALAVRFGDLAGRGVAVVGAAQMALPHLSWPAAGYGEIIALLPVALIVSLVIMIQTAATAQSFSHGAGDLNRDLLGAGFGNILCGLFGLFPADTSPPRTAIVSESGGRSRFAGLGAAILVTLFLLFGMGLLADLPQAALAGLLLFVACRIFRVPMMKTIAAQSLAEFGLLVATALAIIAMPIETGVGIGIALSLLHGVWTIAQTRAMEFEKVPGSTVWWPRNSNFTGERLAGIVVVGFQAPLFFLNAETFRTSLESAVQHAPGPVRAIILEASSIVELDFSGAQVLARMIQDWKSQGVAFYVARLESLRAQQAFEKFGVLPLLGQQRLFHSVDDAVRSLNVAP
jgi:MFS superfamily sulfate permease-like transporter